MKEKRIFVRVSEAQKALIMLYAREENLSVSNYILRHALPIETDLEEDDTSLLIELNHLGNNLNQIAHTLHQTQNYAACAQQVEQLIKKIDAHCEKIMEQRDEYFSLLTKCHRAFLNLRKEELKAKNAQNTLKAEIRLKKLELKKLRLIK